MLTSEPSNWLQRLNQRLAQQRRAVVGTPLGAPALTITSPALLGLKQGPAGQWHWWLLAPDAMGLLADTIGQTPFVTVALRAGTC